MIGRTEFACAIKNLTIDIIYEFDNVWFAVWIL